MNELGAGGESAVPLLHGTKLVTYWHNLIQSSTVSQQSRDGRELYLLANCIDLLRVGRLARLGDALAARWLALEQASLDQGSSAAKHLELYSPEHQTAAGSAVTLAARKFGRLMEKVTAADEKKGKGSNRPRGKGDQGWPRAVPWQEKSKGKGKKGKPKENSWTGRGAWKNQQWGWPGGQGPGPDRRPEPRTDTRFEEVGGPDRFRWLRSRVGSGAAFLRLQ